MINVGDFRDLIDKTAVRITNIAKTDDKFAIMSLYSVYELSCDLDLTAFPFDTQICSIDVGIVDDLSYVSLSLNSDYIYPVCGKGYDPDKQWDLVGTRNIFFSSSTNLNVTGLSFYQRFISFFI